MTRPTGPATKSAARTTIADNGAKRSARRTPITLGTTSPQTITSSTLAKPATGVTHAPTCRASAEKTTYEVAKSSVLTVVFATSTVIRMCFGRRMSRAARRRNGLLLAAARSSCTGVSENRTASLPENALDIASSSSISANCNATPTPPKLTVAIVPISLVIGFRSRRTGVSGYSNQRTRATMAPSRRARGRKRCQVQFRGSSSESQTHARRRGRGAEFGRRR